MSPPLPADAFRRWYEGSLPAQAIPASERAASLAAGSTGYHKMGAISPPLAASG
jgi:hypothetical protein